MVIYPAHFPFVFSATKNSRLDSGGTSPAFGMGSGDSEEEEEEKKKKTERASFLDGRDESSESSQFRKGFTIHIRMIEKLSVREEAILFGFGMSRRRLHPN
jgi:hypothetical protein